MSFGSISALNKKQRIACGCGLVLFVLSGMLLPYRTDTPDLRHRFSDEVEDERRALEVEDEQRKRTLDLFTLPEGVGAPATATAPTAIIKPSDDANIIEVLSIVDGEDLGYYFLSSPANSHVMKDRVVIQMFVIVVVTGCAVLLFSDWRIRLRHKKQQNVLVAGMVLFALSGVALPYAKEKGGHSYHVFTSPPRSTIQTSRVFVNMLLVSVATAGAIALMAHRKQHT